jgi:hypothetical protein
VIPAPCGCCVWLLFAAEDRPLTVGLLRYRPSLRPGTRIEIPLKAINEDKCPGVKDGGWLLFLNYKVRVVWCRFSVVLCASIETCFLSSCPCMHEAKRSQTVSLWTCEASESWRKYACQKCT